MNNGLAMTNKGGLIASFFIYIYKHSQMAKSKNKFNYKLNVHRDTIDFRDSFYVPTLIEVPQEITLSDYMKKQIPILDQKKDGSCTGFALASVAHYLLRSRKIYKDTEPVSPKMIYNLAKKYDEWSGENYEGSSCRGAMKAWHKHGICSEQLWSSIKKSKGREETTLTYERTLDAIKRPLGAYFRVNHKDIRAMHSAISEVGILYASAFVHEEWRHVNSKNFEIKFEPDKPPDSIGGHAFVIVGYDSKGFWIQNSWSSSWGKNGYAKMSYDDWLINGNDVWVARLGAPVEIRSTKSSSKAFSLISSPINSETHFEMRPHVISIGNDGKLERQGTFGNREEDIEEIFSEHFKNITKRWKKKRVMFYAHGGLVNESTALQRVLDYKDFCLKNEIYPVFFIWHTGIWETLSHIIEDSQSKIRTEGFIKDAYNFMLDRLDDGLEILLRKPGRWFWKEMKENAIGSSNKNDGGAKITMDIVKKCLGKENIGYHFVSHSAGSIFFADAVKYFSDKVSEIASCTLWAPACTMELFDKTYLPLIDTKKKIKKFALFTLTDRFEQDDNCASLYHRSLLYLVSNSFEEGTENAQIEILGMEKFAKEHGFIKSMPHDITNKHCWIISPGNKYSAAKEHVAFDDDKLCVLSTMKFILDKVKIDESIYFNRSSASINNKRRALNLTKRN